MKKQLSKKLYYFFILTLLSFTTVNAQIVYTDVNPDDTVMCSGQPVPCYHSYNLDLNNDGTSDFVIYDTSWTSIATTGNCAGQSRTRYIAKVTPLGSNEILTSSSNYTTALIPNTVIGNNSVVWSNATNQILEQQNWGCSYSSGLHGYILSAAYSGYWPNGNENFLGLKIVIGGSTYFGWIRMTCYVSRIIIKDYAYNTIPNQPILAGETTCTIPTVNLTASGSLSFCDGDSVTFTANGAGYQYQWKKNNINITGATAKIYTAKTAGVYKCKVTNSCGTKTSGTRTVTVPCRITNENIVETLEQLSVYPNPSTTSVTIKFPSYEAGEIQIVNLFGQIVYSEKINTEQTQIDVSKFSAGMYIVRWSSGDNNETKRFSVTK